MYYINYFKILRLSLINDCAIGIFTETDEIMTQEMEIIGNPLSILVTKRQNDGINKEESELENSVIEV